MRRLPRISGHIPPGAVGADVDSEISIPGGRYFVEGRINAFGQLARGLVRAGPKEWRYVGRLFLCCAGVFVAVVVVVALADRLF
jgi:hypothetical protein